MMTDVRKLVPLMVGFWIPACWSHSFKIAGILTTGALLAMFILHVRRDDA